MQKAGGNKRMEWGGGKEEGRNRHDKEKRQRLRTND